MEKNNESSIIPMHEEEKWRQAYMETLKISDATMFTLAVTMDELMQQYNLTSHFFLSSVFSNTKRSQQLQVIINALERFKGIEQKREKEERFTRTVEVDESVINQEVQLPPIDEKVIEQLYHVKLTDYSVDSLIKRILNDGIGDWCVLREAEDTGERKISLNQPLLYVTDITTNKEYTLTKQLLMDTINEVWIDFPWAIDVTFNSDLDVMLLTEVDVDEIVQAACMGKVVYQYPW